MATHGTGSFTFRRGTGGAAARRCRRPSRCGSAIDDHSPAEALHDLRKQGKELRYLFELFGSLFPKDALGSAIKDLKWLQDNLGEFQDTEVQRLAVRAFAEELVEVRIVAVAFEDGDQ